eukprot:6201067-Pleurochrysis_carterae.AAC.3
MNKLWKRDADIYLAFRLQLVCKYIIIGLMYASALPAMWLLGFLFFLTSQWVDRWCARNAALDACAALGCGRKRQRVRASERRHAHRWVTG